MTNLEWLRKLDGENLACILGMLPFTPPGRACRKSIKESCTQTIHAGITCNQCWLEWLKKEADCSDGADGSKSKED